MEEGGRDGGERNRHEGKVQHHVCKSQQHLVYMTA